MPLSTKKTTPSIDFGKNNLDPLPEPPEQGTKDATKIVPANEFLSLFDKVKEVKKES